MNYRRSTISKSRWTGATIRGHGREAEERGREANLQQASIHGRTCFQRDEMGREETIDGLAWLVKARGEFLLMCLVHNVKKEVKKILKGRVSLPGKYDHLYE